MEQTACTAASPEAITQSVNVYKCIYIYTYIYIYIYINNVDMFAALLFLLEYH